MPPLPPVYLPGGVPDAILDADLDLQSVAPGTPPRIVEDFPADADARSLTYVLSHASATASWWRRAIDIEATKFREYERSLRDWEEAEKARQRDAVSAPSTDLDAAEAEGIWRLNERRAHLAAREARTSPKPRARRNRRSAGARRTAPTRSRTRRRTA